MPRSINRLSHRTVASTDKIGLYADGGGLYLQVSRFETKSWVFRFTMNGRAREMGLGALHTVTLAEARQAAEQCRKLVREGIDPIEERKAERLRRWLDSAKTMTFKSCAEAYIKVQSSSWSNIKHAAQWRSTLETYAYPVLGDLPVQAIDIGLVLKVVEPIWSTKTETASRVRGRIESILDWAAVRGYRDDDNPARWKGRLDKVLPAGSKVRRVAHHAALPYDQMGTFMEELRRRESVAARGLEFLILTAARTGEVINAQWDEVDLEKALWVVPADRMKGCREHRVPLSDDAVNVLHAIAKVRTSDFIFPGAKTNRPLSNMAFLQQLKRMKRDDLTAHGFRSSFRDWAAERTAYPAEVAEMALAHAVGDKVEAAYRRGDLFEKRRKLMEAWAEFCAQKKDGETNNVVSLNQAL